MLMGEDWTNTYLQQLSHSVYDIKLGVGLREQITIYPTPIHIEDRLLLLL